MVMAERERKEHELMELLVTAWMLMAS